MVRVDTLSSRTFAGRRAWMRCAYARCFSIGTASNPHVCAPSCLRNRTFSRVSVSVVGLCRAGGVFNHSRILIPEVSCAAERAASACINSVSVTVASISASRPRSPSDQIARPRSRSFRSAGIRMRRSYSQKWACWSSSSRVRDSVASCRIHASSSAHWLGSIDVMPRYSQVQT
jgi:hypothetical protein